MKFKFITDRDDISSLPLHIKEEIAVRGLLTKKNSERISFCGMLIEQNKAYIFIPRGSKHQKEKEIEYACLLMSALEKYSLEGKSHLKSNDEDNLEYGLCYLTLAKELLTDYQSHGLYTKISKKELANSGKINWRKTFQRQFPVPGKYGIPIYLQFNGYHYSNTTAHEIALIHAEIVHYLDQYLSWWFIKKPNYLIAPELNKFEKSSLSHDEKLYILNKELNQAYSEREIRLLSNLINFLSQEPGTALTKLVLGVKNFEYLWEEMLNSTLKNKRKNNKNWLPHPIYKSETVNLKDTERDGMRPDIFITNEEFKTAAVIDAKYYDANSSNSLPALHDILKQICYKNAVKLIYPTLEKIDNIFIFPGETQHYSCIEFQHEELEQDDIFQVFPPIKCIYLNPVHVIEAYTNNKHLSNIRSKLLSI